MAFEKTLCPELVWTSRVGRSAPFDPCWLMKVRSEAAQAGESLARKRAGCVVPWVQPAKRTHIARIEGVRCFTLDPMPFPCIAVTALDYTGQVSRSQVPA